MAGGIESGGGSGAGVTRRVFLATVLAAIGAGRLALDGAYVVGGEGVAGCAAESPRVAALRAAAMGGVGGGRAATALAALGPLRHPARPLPFAPEATAPALSAATHRVHFERHYLEYLRRWEVGVRAAEAAGGTPMGETARHGAAMVWLHEAYWRDIGAGVGRGAPPGSAEGRAARSVAERLADLVERRAPWPAEPAFLVVMEVAGPAQLLATAEDVARLGTAAAGCAAALDLAPHAWALDHACLRYYLRAVVPILSPEGRARWGRGVETAASVTLTSSGH